MNGPHEGLEEDFLLAKKRGYASYLGALFFDQTTQRFLIVFRPRISADEAKQWHNALCRKGTSFILKKKLAELESRRGPPVFYGEPDWHLEYCG